ncbi:MAG: hypothetical protein AMJ43_03285 [Coxiella sp. DG_40]|nr:MAG: hypothetical protein AMJ43_03285 [Coxiella sp. DG_40]
MLRFFTDLINPEQSFTERLSTAIKNIGPEFFLVYSPTEMPVSKNIRILLSIINDEVGCYKLGLNQVFNPITGIANDQQLKIKAVMQLINYVATEQDREYLKSKSFPLQGYIVENKQFYSQYINPVVFYLISKNSTLYKSSEAKMLLSCFQDLDEIKFDIIKKYIRKFLLMTGSRFISTQLEQMLLQETLTCVTDQANTDPLFASRYNAILLYRKFIELLALVDQRLENLRETYFSIPESQELITALMQKFSELIKQRNIECSSVYDLKVDSEKLDHLCMGFQSYITKATELFEEIKGYQFSRDELLQKIQVTQKWLFNDLLPEVKVDACLKKLMGESSDLVSREKFCENKASRNAEVTRKKMEQIKAEREKLLVESTLHGWYWGYAMERMGIKLSEDFTYEVLVGIYKENELILQRFAELKDFFDKLLLCVNQNVPSIQPQIRKTLLGLLSETIRNKIISVRSIIEPLLQILGKDKQSEHLNLFIGIVNLVIETAEMWLGNLERKDVLSLSKDDIYDGISCVNRLDKVKHKLTEFLINSKLWSILGKLHVLENNLERKKTEKRDLQIEIENVCSSKIQEFIEILENFIKSKPQVIQPTNCSEKIDRPRQETIDRDKVCLAGQITKILENVKAQNRPFIDWCEEVLRRFERFEKVNKDLQATIDPCKESCKDFRDNFKTYLKSMSQRLEELNNEISKLEEQQQKIRNEVRTIISNIDEKAISIDFGLEEERIKNDHNAVFISEVTKLPYKLDQHIAMMDEKLDRLLTNGAPEVGKYIEDVAILKASREKCYAVLEYDNLSSGVLDCLCDWLHMCIEAVTALSRNMVSLEAKLSPQQEVLETNFSV